MKTQRPKTTQSTRAAAAAKAPVRTTGKSDGDDLTGFVLSPEFSAACLVMGFARLHGEECDRTLGAHAMLEIQAHWARLQSGDTSDVEKMLLCQAVALQAIFNKVADTASNECLGSPKMLSTLEVALQAQNASRASLQALAEIVALRKYPLARTTGTSGAHVPGHHQASKAS